MPEENVTEAAILAQVQQNKELLEKVYKSAEKTRKMFLWTLVISVLTVVLPMVGLLWAIPYFLSSVATSINLDQLGL